MAQLFLVASLSLSLSTHSPTGDFGYGSFDLGYTSNGFTTAPPSSWLLVVSSLLSSSCFKYGAGTPVLMSYSLALSLSPGVGEGRKETEKTSVTVHSGLTVLLHRFLCTVARVAGK